MVKKKDNIGLVDIPLSCSMFLEPALLLYSKYLSKTACDSYDFVHAWNCELVDEISKPQYKDWRGRLGDTLVRASGEYDKYCTRCICVAPDVGLQALHYALRFDMGLNHLCKDEIHSFVDLGIGLSPMTAIYNQKNQLCESYCVDNPAIMDIYATVSHRMGVNSPAPMTWNEIEQMVQKQPLDTIVAIGVLPYMDLTEQIAKLTLINKKFAKFFIEIKYDKNAPRNKNTFNMVQLQELQKNVNVCDGLISDIRKNSVRYVSKFVRAKPISKYFFIGSRSLFLSR